MNTKRALVLNSKDNVATAVEDIEAGDRVNIEGKEGVTRSIKAVEAVPFGFKLALTDIAKGGDIIKYGEVMGRATSDIKVGAQVHVHNVEGVRVQTKVEGQRR